MATVVYPVQNMIQVNVSGTHSTTVTTIALDTGERAKIVLTPPYPLVWWDATNYASAYDDPNWEIIEVNSHPGSGDTIVATRGREVALGGKAATKKSTGSASYKMASVITAYAWQRVQERCAFRANRNADDKTIVTATTTTCGFDTEDFDISSDYDITAKAFVAPRAMVVHFTVGVEVTALSQPDDLLYAYIYKNGTAMAYNKQHAGSSANESMSCIVTDTILVAAGDTIDARVRHNAGADRLLKGTISTSWFSGFEVHPQ
jgi:hypothetical protein